MSVEFIARVGKTNFDRTFMCDRVCFENVVFLDNSSMFREHTWVRKTDRLNKVSQGDIIEFTAEIVEYPSMDSSDVKLGLKKIRNINIL